MNYSQGDESESSDEEPENDCPVAPPVVAAASGAAASLPAPPLSPPAAVPPSSVSTPATTILKRPRVERFVLSDSDDEEAGNDGHSDSVPAANGASPAAAGLPDLVEGEEAAAADEKQDGAEGVSSAAEDESAEDEAANACGSQNSEDMHTSSQPTLHSYLTTRKPTPACKNLVIRHADRGERVVLSLFDHSTHALLPWREAGYKCIAFDLKHPQGETCDEETGIFCRGVDLYDEEELDRVNEEFKDTAFLVSAFPPCTNFSQAGRRTWGKKRKLNPNFQNDDADRFQRLRERLNRWGVRYYMENPDTGKLKQLLTYSDHTFHPNEYGKYLQSDDVHPLAKYPPRDAYEKLTGLWVGNGFKMPERRAVKPDKSFSIEQLQSKDRSHTPRGFARAVCLANYES